MQSKDLSYFITRFFTQYLTSEKNVSNNTVKAYRDTFLLLFSYLKDQRGVRIEKLSVQDLSRDNIARFLNWLENDRGNSIATRNQRLAAIHAFFKYLQVEKVEYL